MTGGERAEQRVRRGHGGERREVDAQPEEPVERAARELLADLIDAPAGEHDRQARRVWPSHLRHRQRDRRAVERHHALIRVRVPAIDRIVGGRRSAQAVRSRRNGPRGSILGCFFLAIFLSVDFSFLTSSLT